MPWRRLLEKRDQSRFIVAHEATRLLVNNENKVVEYAYVAVIGQSSLTLYHAVSEGGKNDWKLAATESLLSYIKEQKEASLQGEPYMGNKEIMKLAPGMRYADSDDLREALLDLDPFTISVNARMLNPKLIERSDSDKTVENMINYLK